MHHHGKGVYSGTFSGIVGRSRIKRNRSFLQTPRTVMLNSFVVYFLYIQFERATDTVLAKPPTPLAALFSLAPDNRKTKQMKKLRKMLLRLSYVLVDHCQTGFRARSFSRKRERRELLLARPPNLSNSVPLSFHLSW